MQNNLKIKEKRIKASNKLVNFSALLLVFIFLISFSSAKLEVGIDGSELGSSGQIGVDLNINPLEINIGGNYSINVNNTDLWNGFAWDIDRWLLTDGTNSPTADINWNGFDIDFFGGNIDNVSHIQFNLIGDGCVDEGCLEWNPEDGTLDLTMPGGTVKQQIGEENLRRIKANEDLLNGDVVYPCGGVANRLLVCKADYGSIATAGVIGIATEDITKDQFGFINSFGLVRDINTTGEFGACTEGLPVWLSNDGKFTCIPPTGNEIRVVLGVIVNTHSSTGILDVQMQSVPRLQGLSQVNGTGITDDSSLSYNATTGIWDNKLRYDFAGLHVIADDFIIDGMTLNGGTYNSTHDWASTTQSSGKISGGTFTSNGDGTVTISAGTGMIRETNSATAPVLFFDWAENSSVPLTDQSTNYIHVDYNSGNPSIHSTTDISTVNNRDSILLGKIFKEGSELHEIEAGMLITELAKNTLSYFTQVFGEVVRSSGAVVSETGTLNLATTEGVIFAGLTRLTTPSQDTSGADTFEYFYYDGATWTEEDKSQINNSYYNDITSGLVELTPNRYGVHWVYVDGDSDGKMMVVYGQGDYTLTQAELAQPPSSLHAHVADFGFLAGKIIIKKGQTTFLSLSSAYDTQFTPSGATEHNELSGLQGGQADEYFHLTSSDYTNRFLRDGSIPMTDNINGGGNNATNFLYGFFDFLDIGGNLISIISGRFDFSLGALFNGDISADNYKNMSIIASGSQINFSINGSSTLSTTNHMVLDDGNISFSTTHPTHFRMHGGENGLISTATQLGEQWSVANGENQVANEIAVCDGEFYKITLSCRTSSTTANTVNISIGADGSSVAVQSCGINSEASNGFTATSECITGSTKFQNGDYLTFDTTASDGNANICVVYGWARCY